MVLIGVVMWILVAWGWIEGQHTSKVGRGMAWLRSRMKRTATRQESIIDGSAVNTAMLHNALPRKDTQGAHVASGPSGEREGEDGHKEPVAPVAATADIPPLAAAAAVEGHQEKGKPALRLAPVVAAGAAVANVTTLNATSLFRQCSTPVPLTNYRDLPVERWGQYLDDVQSAVSDRCSYHSIGRKNGNLIVNFRCVDTSSHLSVPTVTETSS
jgi:hypothetical protein